MTISKHNVLGVRIAATDYAGAVQEIISAAQSRRGLAVTALAVHGLMTGFSDPVHRYRLNSLDLVLPDGQPVRWALNARYRAGLADRVYGPRLTLQVCEKAAQLGLPVFFYGSRTPVLALLTRNLIERFPGLIIAGVEPSRFGSITQDEKSLLVTRIRDSGAAITFVGLGCPRQEIFAYEFRNGLNMPILAVGAAFDYHAGVLREPPEALQNVGLQWLFRLLQEPRRLWRRYLVLNSKFLFLFGAQLLGLWRPDCDKCKPPESEVLVA